MSVRGEILPTVVNLDVGAEGDEVAAAQRYLQIYGYLGRSTRAEAFGFPMESPEPAPSSGGLFDEPTRRALENFQRFHGIDVSGRLDGATAETMNRPRCGLPDRITPALGTPPGETFAVFPPGWGRTNVTYAFGAMSGHIGADAVRATVQQGLAGWSGICALSFTEVGWDANPDIKIEFLTADPEVPFNSGEAGHTWTPLDGRVHMNDNAHWGSHLEFFEPSIAHELGHALGLGHSFAGTLMYPTAQKNVLSPQDDDKAGIVSLYCPR